MIKKNRDLLHQVFAIDGLKTQYTWYECHVIGQFATMGPFSDWKRLKNLVPMFVPFAQRKERSISPRHSKQIVIITTRLKMSTKVTTIVMALDGWYVHLGFSTECTPAVSLPNTTMPLIPPLTFATRLLHAITTRLSVPPARVPEHEVAIVQPLLGFGVAERDSITQALRLLKFRGHKFYTTIAAAGAGAATPYPLVIHVAPEATCIASAHRIIAVPMGSRIVDDSLATALLESGHRLDAPELRYLRELCGVCTSEAVGNVTVHSRHSAINVGNERARSWDAFFSPIGKLSGFLQCYFVHLLTLKADVLI